VRHGRIWGSRETIAGLALDLACNTYGSEFVGRQLHPLIARAVEREAFELLPRQELPVVFNTKGASASGKSTLRPRQRQLAADIGVKWSEFAIISPDIWRKQLLDYGSLGPHYKYAGSFTGEELKIVDQRLDRYMARKGARGEMPHLLIDRFVAGGIQASSPGHKKVLSAHAFDLCHVIDHSLTIGARFKQNCTCSVSKNDAHGAIRIVSHRRVHIGADHQDLFILS